MRRRVVGGVVAGAVVAVVAASATVAIAASSSNGNETTDYCADMSDSIGLYTGNPVTQMGFSIGKVHSVEPRGSFVRVDFSVDNGRALPASVRAVTRSKSILADRSLELVGNYAGGRRLTPDRCIALDQTATPKSISEVAGSLSDFIGGLTADGDREALRGAVNGLERALRGNGGDINSLIRDAAGALASPDQLSDDIGRLIATLAPFTDTTLQNWGTLRNALQLAGPALNATAGGLWPGVAKFLTGLTPLLSAIYDVQSNYGNEVGVVLDVGADVINLAATRADDIRSLIATIPAVSSMVKQVSAGGGPPRVRVAMPVVSLDARAAAAICPLITSVRPRACSAGAGGRTAANIDLTDLVFAESAGRR